VVIANQEFIKKYYIHAVMATGLSKMFSRDERVQLGTMHVKLEEKHKVTLYISPELHRQLKVQAALEEEPMSTLTERALAFYLEHGDLVEERLGQSYRLHSCPSCKTPVILRDGELTSLPETSGAILDDTRVAPVLSLR